MFNLNCNPGDIAIVIKGPEKWIGKILTCVYHSGEMPILPVKDNKRIWKVDVELPYFYSNLGKEVMLTFCPDEYLKPLRYQDGDDEMIKIAGKAKEKAEV